MSNDALLITFDKDKMKQIDDSKNNKDKTKAKVAFSDSRDGYCLGNGSDHDFLPILNIPALSWEVNLTPAHCCRGFLIRSGRAL